MSAPRTREPQKIPVREIARGLACDSRVHARNAQMTASDVGPELRRGLNGIWKRGGGTWNERKRCIRACQAHYPGAIDVVYVGYFGSDFGFRGSCPANDALPSDSALVRLEIKQQINRAFREVEGRMNAKASAAQSEEPLAQCGGKAIKGGIENGFGFCAGSETPKLVALRQASSYSGEQLLALHWLRHHSLDTEIIRFARLDNVGQAACKHHAGPIAACFDSLLRRDPIH